MGHAEFHSLVEDTLVYLKAQLPPSRCDVKALSSLPPLPEAPKKKIEPKAASKPSPQLPLPPQPPPTEKKEEKKEWITLTPPPLPNLDVTTPILKQLKALDPNLYFHDNVPSDHLAREIKESWKAKHLTPAIPILFQGTHYRSFVQNLAKAIDILYGSCRIIELTKDQNWEAFLESPNLRLIIAPDNLIFQSKELLPFYQENPQKKSKRLGRVPLLLLPDLSFYFKDPYLKRALWNVIKRTLSDEGPQAI